MASFRKFEGKPHMHGMAGLNPCPGPFLLLNLNQLIQIFLIGIP